MNEIDTLNDLLNSDLSSTPTNFPVLVGGLYQFKFQEPAIADTKAKDGSKNLHFKCVLVAPNPAKATDGRDVNAGFSFTHNIYLPKPGASDDKSRKAREISMQNLASLKEALTGSKAGGFGDPANYVGMEFTAAVKVENSPEYGEQNRISRFIPKKS